MRRPAARPNVAAAAAFVVGDERDGQRLDVVVLAWLRDRSEARTPPTRAAVQRLIVRGAVAVNGRVLRHPSSPVRRGSRVVCTMPGPLDGPSTTDRRRSAPHPAGELSGRVLYRDEWVLAVDKPAGLPTHATVDPARPHLVAAVVGLLQGSAGGGAGAGAPPYVGVHHRLDAGTSGVVLFSVHRDANAGLAAAFAERRVAKRYVAVAAVDRRRRPAGAAAPPPGRRWTVRDHLARISPRSQRARYGPVPAGGDLAETTFTVLALRPGGRLLLQAEPHTGRSHQIRVHAAGCGLPLVGDELYGGPAGPRVLLHAAGLSLEHPVTGAPLVLEAPLPPDFDPR